MYMKKILFIIFGIALIVPAVVAQADEISRFNMHAIVNDDATVYVTEEILYDFGSNSKHGIYRDIPIKYKTATGNNRSINIDDIVVTDADGQERTFVVSNEGKNKRIKIGDANKMVTGMQVYTILYTVDGAINYFDDHDEFYWNVTGNDWPVHMNAVNAHVNALGLLKTDCFVGRYGSIDACDDVSEESDAVKFTNGKIESRENMSIVVGVRKGIIHQPTIINKIMKFTQDNWILITPFVIFVVMWRRWLRLGRDPKGRGTVVPQYQSPDNLSPAEVGMIIDEKVHPHDISALMINLAVKGCIHIRKNDDDYIFVKLDQKSCDLVSEEQMLYDSIFDGTKTAVKVSELKNKFYADFTKIKGDVVNTVIQKGYYDKSPQNVQAIYVTIGLLMFTGSFFVMPVLGGAVSVALLLSSFSVMGFGYFMPRRTKKGAIAREEILGLKMYMETAEKDRINFHNAPEKKPEHFEILLPYAMALGVEKAWAKQFEDIYNSKPQWYEGSANFNAVAFANDLHAFSNKTASAFTSRPASASSGSSGFSGGGSGGGFGGGGGGSW